MKEMQSFGGTEGGLVRDFANSLRKPGFWSYSAWLDIVTKYRRSRLGIVWMLIPAALYVWGIGWFFGGNQVGQLGLFVAHLGVGFLLFRFVMMVVSDSASVAASQRALILDGRTRLTDFVFRVIAKSFFYLLMALPVLLPVAFMGIQGCSWISILMALGGVLLIVLNCLWLSTVIAMAGARFPDIQEFTTSLYILMFVFTPIMWRGSDVTLHSFRGVVMLLNPVYHMIEIVRAPLLSESGNMTSLWVMLVMTVIGWILASVLYKRYVRMVPIWV